MAPEKPFYTWNMHVFAPPTTQGKGYKARKKEKPTGARRTNAEKVNLVKRRSSKGKGERKYSFEPEASIQLFRRKVKIEAKIPK